MATPALAMQPQTSQPPQQTSAFVRAMGETDVNRRTNVGLGIALLIGLLVIWLGFERYPTGMMWAGACLGIGALLGFLFGIPKTQTTVVVERANVAAIGGRVDVEANAGTGASVKGGQASTDSASESDQAPRQNADQAQPAPAAQMSPAMSSMSGESNLEQISDWVTKLLVGGSLTQLQDIPGYFWSWGGSLAAGLLGTSAAAAGTAQSTQAAQVFATGLIIYFLILGFFAGYLITILQLRSEIRAHVQG